MITRLQSNNIDNNSCSFKGLNAEKFLRKAADLNSVHQRFATGAAALAFQPIIDLQNKDIDKETRQVSAVRSAAKAVIGTAIGLIVRKGTIKLGENIFAKKDEAGKIIRECGAYVLDEEKVHKIFGESIKKLDLKGEQLQDTVKRIPAAVGTIVGLGVMLFSNFLIDAPLTNLMMDKLNAFLENRKNAKQQKTAPEVKNG